MLSPTPVPDPDPRHAAPARAPRGRRRTSVTCRLNFHLLPAPTGPDAPPDATGPQWSPVPVAARLSWTRREPRAVALSFRTGAQPVVWTISRELLAAGLLAPAGLGDVTVLPDPTDPGLTELVLSSPSGHACLRFLTSQVADYLRRLPDPPQTSPAVTALLAAVARHDGLGEAA